MSERYRHYDPYDSVIVRDADERYTVTLWACARCGAMVREQAVHDQWHDGDR